MEIARNRGFTVVELMITLLVLSILVVISAPALTDLIKNNRMLSQVYAMRAVLNGARARAMSERTFVTVCPSNDGAACGGNWNEGFISFTDFDGNGLVADPNDPAGDQIIGMDTEGVANFEIRFTETGNLNNQLDRLRFSGQGHATGFKAATPYLGQTFTICDDRGNSAARGLLVSPVGAVRAAVVDPNDPGSDDLADC